MTWQQFLEKYKARIRQHESMARHLTLRVGGPTRYFLEIKTNEELVEALETVQRAGQRYAIIAGGSNSLFGEVEFAGLVIKLATQAVQFEGSTVRAEAGVRATVLARRASQRGLTGLEWMATLPGTVGGAVRGNAGCFGGEVKDCLENVEVWRAGRRAILSKAECQFDYRHSIFKQNDDVILAATFMLKNDDPVSCEARIAAATLKRQSSQPAGTPSAGCIFKNFVFQNEAQITKLTRVTTVPGEFIVNKKIPAGWLIEEAGLKGFCLGGACISSTHGNFLVMSKDATADQALQLVSVIKTRIRNQFGIQLIEEVQIFV